jgi:hypothetical protein
MKTLMLASALALIATAAQAQYYGTGRTPTRTRLRATLRTAGPMCRPTSRRIRTIPSATTSPPPDNVNPYTGTVGHRTPRY